MKHLFIIALISIFTISSAQAAENGKGKACKHRGDMKAKILEKFDANNDGKLDESERAAAKTAVQAKRQERIAKLKSEHPKLFEKIDSNGDGNISKDEAKAARAMRKQHCDKKKGERGDKADGKRSEIANKIKERRANRKEK